MNNRLQFELVRINGSLLSTGIPPSTGIPHLTGIPPSTCAPDIMSEQRRTERHLEQGSERDRQTHLQQRTKPNRKVDQRKAISRKKSPSRSALTALEKYQALAKHRRQQALRDEITRATSVFDALDLSPTTRGIALEEYERLRNVYTKIKSTTRWRLLAACTYTACYPRPKLKDVVREFGFQQKGMFYKGMRLLVKGRCGRSYDIIDRADSIQ